MTAAFDLLHPKIQEAIWNQETPWERLRPLQEDSIRAVLTREDHVILAAATASGKTEAAFLPILSKLAEEPDRRGVGAIYVGPLKALINDQFRRLEELCHYAQISVHKWHGDVPASKKKKFRENPGGLLLITPESLESNFINYGKQLEWIYSNLEFVVIDELHSFLDDVRGIHLQSLLARLRVAAGVKPRMLGLSATLGKWEVAQRFLNPSRPEDVEVISPESSRGDLKVVLRSYLKVRHEEAENAEDEETGAIDDLAGDLAKHFRKDSNLIFTNSRGLAETLADKLNQRSKREKWPTNPFRIHHGSIGREIREEVEAELKASGKKSMPVTAFCTSTLEMGIDIGAAKAVGQIGPPWSVNSMVQRVGRSGRREGESSILRGYALDYEITKGANIEDRFYTDLLRFGALIELMIEGWLEPLDQDDWHLSTFIHQVLSILRQTGGTRADVLHRQLCEVGAFSKIDPTVFREVLRGLGKAALIEQMSDGTLILAPDGEAIVEDREFYGAFASNEEFSVRCGDQLIGLIQSDLLPPVGQHLILSGRRWRLVDVDGEQLTAYVERSSGYTKPMFGGGGGFIHNRIVAKMREILTSNSALVYLHEDGMKRIIAAREEYDRLRMDERAIVAAGPGLRWFPWVGTRALLTLVTAATQREIDIDCCRYHLHFPKLDSLEEFSRMLADLEYGNFDPVDLASFLPTKHFHKFDEWVDGEILDQSNALRILDMETASAAAARLRTNMSGKK